MSDTRHATRPLPEDDGVAGEGYAFRYVDLFAGIGGFAAVGEALGGRNVYSVEIDKQAAAVYESNWGHKSLGDITEDATDLVMNVPAHDILFAGLPCQPFSKSGLQRGFQETRGTLYENVMHIIMEHHPSVIVLENVRNLAGPRHAHELEVIVETLRDEGYRIADAPAIYSPHLVPPTHGGRPQVRERVFVTATYNADDVDAALPVEPVLTPRDRINGWEPHEWDLAADLPLDEDHHVTGCDLTKPEELWIDAWNDWVEQFYELTNGRQPPGFPIWADAWVPTDDLEISEDTPKWKRNFLIKNAALYTEHKEAFDAWVEKWGVKTDAFPASRRKLEWQAQDTPRLWDCVMHLRPSGIRAKKPNYLPALVAITQTSIIGPRGRRLSPREAARLQGLPDGFNFGDQRSAATYRQLGNGVSIGAVWNVLKAHVDRDEDILKRTEAGQRILAAVAEAPASPDTWLNERFQEPDPKSTEQ